MASQLSAELESYLKDPGCWGVLVVPDPSKIPSSLKEVLISKLQNNLLRCQCAQKCPVHKTRCTTLGTRKCYSGCFYNKTTSKFISYKPIQFPLRLSTNQGEPPKISNRYYSDVGVNTPEIAVREVSTMTVGESSLRTVVSTLPLKSMEIDNVFEKGERPILAKAKLTQTNQTIKLPIISTVAPKFKNAEVQVIDPTYRKVNRRDFEHLSSIPTLIDPDETLKIKKENHIECDQNKSTKIITKHVLRYDIQENVLDREKDERYLDDEGFVKKSPCEIPKSLSSRGQLNSNGSEVDFKISEGRSFNKRPSEKDSFYQYNFVPSNQNLMVNLGEMESNLSYIRPSQVEMPLKKCMSTQTFGEDLREIKQEQSKVSYNDEYNGHHLVVLRKESSMQALDPKIIRLGKEGNEFKKVFDGSNKNILLIKRDEGSQNLDNNNRIERGPSTISTTNEYKIPVILKRNMSRQICNEEYQVVDYEIGNISSKEFYGAFPFNLSVKNDASTQVFCVEATPTFDKNISVPKDMVYTFGDSDQTLTPHYDHYSNDPGKILEASLSRNSEEYLVEDLSYSVQEEPPQSKEELNSFRNVISNVEVEGGQEEYYIIKKKSSIAIPYTYIPLDDSEYEIVSSNMTPNKDVDLKYCMKQTTKANKERVMRANENWNEAFNLGDANTNAENFCELYNYPQFQLVSASPSDEEFVLEEKANRKLSNIASSIYSLYDE